jgi:hypothetical protein
MGDGVEKVLTAQIVTKRTGNMDGSFRLVIDHRTHYSSLKHRIDPGFHHLFHPLYSEDLSHAFPGIKEHFRCR